MPRQNLLKAVELDPKFGVGYLALAGVSRNLQQLPDAEKYINQAMSHLDGMTEREQYTTRGMLYRITGDYQHVREGAQRAIQRYAADVIGHNQLALCASQLRDLTRARDEMSAVVKILPNRAVFRDNLALYSNYAGDFETGEKEARTVLEHGARARRVRAARAGVRADGAGPGGRRHRDVQHAGASCRAWAPRSSASGLARPGHRGRPVFGSRSDCRVKAPRPTSRPRTPTARPRSLPHQAYAQLLRGQKALAVAAADKALANSKAVKIRFLAARIFVEAGQPAKATPLMTGLVGRAPARASSLRQDRSRR